MPRKHATPSPPRARFKIRLKSRLSAALGALTVVAVCIAVRWISGPKPADANGPDGRGTAASNGIQQVSANGPSSQSGQKPQIVAVVNNQQITRQELAQECISHYGKDVLESMVNKFLILQYCQQHGVTVTQKDVNDEIDRMAHRFNLSPDQWVKMLEQERGIAPEQYANDIVWPTVALKKLSADRLQPSAQELQDAYDAQFGEAVKARMIVVDSASVARQVEAQAKAEPEKFGFFAKKYSVDTSASADGMIQPIHRHVGEKQIEDAVFQMNPGDISPIIQVGSQFVILKCEGRLPAARLSIDMVKERLADSIKDRKLRSAAADLFQSLQKRAVIQNVINDPVKSREMPGVAATVNDHKITMRELAEECIDRHGKEVLEGTINRRLLDQAIKGHRLAIVDQDIDAEVQRAALSAGKTTKDNQPDVKAWLDLVTKEQGISIELYVHDAVWPSVALKKLVGDVAVTKEDLQRGYEANYGPRSRCRVIVVKSERKADEVWKLARHALMDDQHPDPEAFGQLAVQYSVDPSRSVGGRVPSIQRHGGAPLLEEEAFKLKPGELSSIVQVGDNFVILYCEGFTEPQKIEMAAVRDLLYEDIHEKKIRIAMGQEFDHLKETAQIDNFLTGESQTPKSARVPLQENAGATGGGGRSSGNRVTPASAYGPVAP